MAVTLYGDITPRTAGFVVKDLLARGAVEAIIEKFAQTYVLPSNSTKTAMFRRYFLTGAPGTGTGTGSQGTVLATTPLVEGVPPAGQKLSKHDIQVTVAQYGDFTTITDVIEDTHEDPILKTAVELLGEQVVETMETLRYNVIKAGTSVSFANGTVRSDVNTPITLSLLQTAVRGLNRQRAKLITQVVKASPNYATEPVEAGYVCLVHPDLDKDIRAISGFIPVKKYGTMTPWAHEIGAVENVRFVRSVLFIPFADAGGLKLGMISTTGTNADVYPCTLLARDAFGVVALKGKNSIVPMVVNAKPAHGNPLGQSGTVGWKTWFAAHILNDAWMTRIEVAATV
ncbi:MAG: N4-gp56 family major capsid protein [bacterium]